MTTQQIQLKPPELLQEEGKRLFSKPEDDASSPIDYRSELHKLNRSVMQQFTELLKVLVRCPSHHQTMVDDIELMLINMHDLLNSFRPHQAREIVIDRLKQQIELHKTATRELQECIDRSLEKMQKATESLVVASREAPSSNAGTEAAGESESSSDLMDISPDERVLVDDSKQRRAAEAAARVSAVLG